MKKRKSKLRWVLLGALGLLVLLGVVAAVVLPRLVDAESYRGLLRSNLERQLGREVEFGAMELSLWPVLGLRLDDLVIGRTPAERFDKPVVAESLRVGARLFPLLRGRLEVTTLIVEGPVLTLYRRDDGIWEPVLTAGGDPAAPGRPEGADTKTGPAQPATDGPALVIEQLRVTRARVVLRRDDAGRLRETTLDDLTLRLDGLGTGGPVSFDLSTGLGASGTFQGNGKLQPADDAAGRPLPLSARVEVGEMAPATLREWLAALAPTVTLGEELLDDRSFSSSATIDYTGGSPARLAISDAVVRELGLRLVRSASGAWNYAALLDPTGAEPQVERSEEMAIQLSDLTIEDTSIRIEDHSAPTRASRRVMDRTAAGGPAVLNVAVLRLSLDRLPTAGPAALELDARVGSGKDGKLAVRGKLGPLGDDPAAMPLDLSLKLGATALGDVRFLLPAMENLNVSKAAVAADLRLSGTFTGNLEVRGDVSLSNATVSFVSPGGGARTLPLDLRVRGDVGLRDSAARIELAKLELELPREDANRTLTLRGSVNAASDPPRIDLELLPTRVAADDLAALAALFAPDAPLSFASPNPVELELRARGPLGGESLPDLEGRATLSDFTFRFAGMTQPMEKVGAKVTFSPDKVTLDGLGGVIGKSDVTASRVVVTNFAAPRVQVDLSSRNADFWELFSFVESDEPAAGATPAVGDDPLSRLTIEGTLRIEQGSLQTLAFEKLTTGMDFRGGVLTLAPLEMSLYGGRFAGKIVQDLNADVLTISGNGGGVDADGFLAQNLALGGLISGRASTDLNVQVRAADPANVLAGVSGGGPLQLVDGQLAKLNVLKSLSKVTGIFGERSLQRLTKQFATAGTSFRRAETRLSFNSGTLAFEDLVIEAAELTLAGRAALESATGKLDGRFEVSFSPELSAAMRDEKSRAADLFWDPKAQRVSFGFGVGGLATAPSVSVDWDTALRGVAERKLGDQVRGLLERKLGVGAKGGATSAGGATTAGAAEIPQSGGPEPSGSAATSSSTGTPAAAGAAEGSGTPVEGSTPGSPSGAAAAGTPAGTSGASSSVPGLVAEITQARWKGPVLLRDLSLEGNVRGAGIERASLAVVDARGSEVHKIDRLGPVDDQLASVSDRDAEATVSWRAEIDGKRMLAARFPVKVTVTVYDRQGRSASATREVDR